MTLLIQIIFCPSFRGKNEKHRARCCCYKTYQFSITSVRIRYTAYNNIITILPPTPPPFHLTWVIHCRQNRTEQCAGLARETRRVRIHVTRRRYRTRPRQRNDYRIVRRYYIILLYHYRGTSQFQ